jgi:hypothetical protein
MEDLMDLKQKHNWLNFFDLYRKSGLSKAAFCKSHKISESKFYYYSNYYQKQENIKSVINTPVPKQSMFIPMTTKKEFKIKINESVSLSFDSAPDASWMASFIKSFGEYHAAV